jgi:glycosyltransferase involved in cell wall biosynthesis
MKILCVIDSLCFGGAQRQLVELAFAFKERGHLVSFLTYHDIPFFNRVIENEGLTVACVKELNYLKRLFKMRRFIRQGKYDAVLSFLEAAGFICEFAGLPYRRWKLVVGERSANPQILGSMKLRMYRWFHCFSDYVVANSNTNMQLVRTVNPFLPKSKCRVIFNLVDFNRYKPDANFIFRQHDKLSLVIAARIKQEKNMDGLIEALSRLSKEELDKIRVDWYGEYMQQYDISNSLTKSLEQIERKGLGNMITFHEATHDIVRIIQESDAVGLFSHYEGFPNVICEAMACKKPVVCTKVSDIADFLSHDPNLLCNPDDPYSIQKSLSYLINLDNNQLESIGTKNREIALEKFNPKKIVSDYLQLLGDGIQ